MGREPDSIIGDRAFNRLRHRFQSSDDKDTHPVSSEGRQGRGWLAVPGARSHGRTWSGLQ
jgi:hypothetical protein